METALIVPSQLRWAASLIERSVADDDARLDASDSAFYALTDFRREYPLAVEANCSVDDALADMKRLSVHALLVTRQKVGHIEQQIVGLITHYDIERRCPHRYPRTGVSSDHGDIRVGDVMTPWNELPLVHYESLQTLTALDLHQMFQGTGLTHLLVVETHGDESALARGLLSRAALGKRLHRARD
jgi:CBS domain-containing protein